MQLFDNFAKFSAKKKICKLKGYMPPTTEILDCFIQTSLQRLEEVKGEKIICYYTQLKLRLTTAATPYISQLHTSEC